jgi:hypothetical protein
MLRGDQLGHALREIEVADPLVAHGKLCKRVQWNRLRQSAKNEEDQYLYFKLIMDKTEIPFHMPHLSLYPVTTKSIPRCVDTAQ